MSRSLSCCVHEGYQSCVSCRRSSDDIAEGGVAAVPARRRHQSHAPPQAVIGTVAQEYGWPPAAASDDRVGPPLEVS